MSKEEVYSRLKEVFEEVFENDIELTDATTAADVPGWDSLSHVTLMLRVQSEFKMHFPMKDVVHIRNVGDMVDLIMKNAEEI